MVARPTVVSQARRELIEYVRSKGLNPGDRLPPVAALAEHCKVSTPAMREALQALQANGFVDIRHGTGVFVRRHVDRLILPNVQDTYLDTTVIMDLLHARALIEPRLAASAARRASDEDLDELRDALHAAEIAGQETDSELRTATVHFHRILARCSGDLILGEFIDSVLDIYSNEQLIITYLHGNREEDHQGHSKVYEALRSRDPDTAQQAMQEHLDEVVETVQRRLATAERAPNQQSGT